MIVILVGVIRNLNGVLTGISLIDEDIEYVFINLLAICILIFEREPFVSFSSLLIICVCACEYICVYVLWGMYVCVLCMCI